jgi:hypothetical protein
VDRDSSAVALPVRFALCSAVPIDARGGAEHRSTLAALTAITLVGVLLRIVQLGGVPFQHGDDISTAWAATWHFPRGWKSFQLGDASAEPNPIGIVTLTHGPLQVMVALLWASAAASAGVRITESTWHLPFALLGGLVVPLTYLFGTRLQSRRAGLLAAAFVAVIPLHVAFSRTSGESHFVLASLLQVISLTLWWRHLETRSPPLALATGVAVACDLLTDFAFPGLLLTLIAATWLHGTRSPAPRGQVLRTLGQARLIVPLLAAVTVHVYAVALAAGGQRTGMYGRFLSEAEAGHTRVFGVFVPSVLDNLRHATDDVALAAIGACVAAFLTLRRCRTPGAALALFWACVYLVPFVFLVQRGGLIGHYIPIAVALCAFSALVLDTLLAGGARFAAGAVAIAMAGSLFLSTLSTVFAVPLPPPFVHQPDHGSIGVDRGTKAAAWWVRRHTPPDALVFADPFAQQTPSVAMYYYHRPVLSLDLGGGAGMQDVFEMLAANQSRLSLIVVGDEQLAQLSSDVREAFRTSAVVTVDGRESLHLLTRRSGNDGDATPQRLESSLYSARYDEQHTTLAEITALPLREIQIWQARLGMIGRSP